MRYMPTSARSQQYLTLSLLYVVAWGISLLNYDGIYWDDWLITGNTAENIETMFDQAGAIFTGTVHQALAGVGNGVWIYRLISFGSAWITGLMIFHLLLGLGRLSTSDAFYLSALSVVYPVNQARIAIVNTPYAYSVAIFFAAFVLLTGALRAKRVGARVLSLGLFFVSFEIPSLLMFYTVPVVYVLLQEREEWTDEAGRPHLRRARSWALRRLDIICLPLVFLILKVVYFSPYGLYDGYNTVTLERLGQGSWKSLWPMYQASVAAINAAVADLSSVIVPLAAVLVFYFSRIPDLKRHAIADRRFYLGMFLVGLLLLYLAVFPYTTVEKMGSSLDWESRHQLLTPLGGSFCLYALLRLLMGRASSWYIALAMSVILTTFAHKDVLDMARYQVDWAKQQSIIEQVKQVVAVRDNPGKRFLIVDNAPEYNAARRVYRYWELSGFLRSAFNDNSRLAVSEASMPTVEELGEGPAFLALNNIDARGTEEMVGRITIESVDRTHRPSPALTTYFFRLFERPRLPDFVTLEYRSCSDSPTWSGLGIPPGCVR